MEACCSLANAARSPGQAATAAAAPAADSAAHSASHEAASGHGASREAASRHGASREATSGHRATAAAAAALGEYDVVLKDSVGFLVEDVERREADVGDFLLTERDFAR